MQMSNGQYVTLGFQVDVDLPATIKHPFVWAYDECVQAFSYIIQGCPHSNQLDEAGGSVGVYRTSYVITVAPPEFNPNYKRAVTASIPVEAPSPLGKRTSLNKGLISTHARAIGSAISGRHDNACKSEPNEVQLCCEPSNGPSISFSESMTAMLKFCDIATARQGNAYKDDTLTWAYQFVNVTTHFTINGFNRTAFELEACLNLFANISDECRSVNEMGNAQIFGGNYTQGDTSLHMELHLLANHATSVFTIDKRQTWPSSGLQSRGISCYPSQSVPTSDLRSAAQAFCKLYSNPNPSPSGTQEHNFSLASGDITLSRSYSCARQEPAHYSACLDAFDQIITSCQANASHSIATSGSLILDNGCTTYRIDTPPSRTNLAAHLATRGISPCLGNALWATRDFCFRSQNKPLFEKAVYLSTQSFPAKVIAPEAMTLHITATNTCAAEQSLGFETCEAAFWGVVAGVCAVGELPTTGTHEQEEECWIYRVEAEVS